MFSFTLQVWPSLPSVEEAHSFLSTILEKVVANRLNSHINISKLSNHYSLLTKNFSQLKLLFFKIHSDILDNGKVTAYTLLDLSAAFDTINHTILLRWLDEWFRVTGKAIDWFKSYLTGRYQKIKLGDCLSSKSDLTFGVPQGSVLGPLLFTLYTTPLHSLAWFLETLSLTTSMLMMASCVFHFHQVTDSAVALNGLQLCLASVQSWMSMNKLKLNPDKTEFLLIGNKRPWSKYHSMFPIEFFGVKTYPAKSAQNFGSNS